MVSGAFATEADSPESSPTIVYDKYKNIKEISFLKNRGRYTHLCVFQSASILIRDVVKKHETKHHRGKTADKSAREKCNLKLIRRNALGM